MVGINKTLSCVSLVLACALFILICRDSDQEISGVGVAENRDFISDDPTFPLEGRSFSFQVPEELIEENSEKIWLVGIRGGYARK